MDDNAKPCTPKSETSDWRAEFTPSVRRHFLQKILDALNREVAPSSDPNTSYRMVRISQHLEQKAFRDATSKDDYVCTINGRIMGSIQKLRDRLVSSSSSSNSDVTQTSMAVGTDQISRLQNVHQDIAGSPVRQGVQSDRSGTSRREIPGIQSSQKVVYEQNQQQELQHQHKVQQAHHDILNNHQHKQQQHIASQPSQLQSLKVLPEQLSSKQQPVSLQSNVIDLQQPLRMFTTQPNDMNIQSSGPSLHRVGDTYSKQNVQPTGLPLPIHQLPVSQKQSSQPQNVIDKQKQQLSQGTSGEVSSASVESKALGEQANIAEWHDQGYQKVQSMKEKFLPQLKDFYNMLDVLHQKTPEPEMAEKYSKKMNALKTLIKFLFTRPNDVVQFPRAVFECYLEKVLEAVKYFQTIKSVYVAQRAPLHQPSDGQSSQVSQLQQLRNRNLQSSSAHSTFTSTPADSVPASSMQQGILGSQLQRPLQMLLPVTPCQVHFTSPKITQHSSAQADQQALLSSLSIGGQPLHSPGSTLTTASTAAPLTPFTTPADHEILTSTATPLSIPHKLGHTQTTVASTKVDKQNGILNQPVAATSSGISTSRLPIKSTNPDGNQQSSSTRQPLQRLLDAVESLSPKSLSASVSEMVSVVNLIETLAGTASNNSRAPVGEDLTYGTRRNLGGGKFRLRNICSVNVSSCDISESTAPSRFKRHRIEPINALLDEMRHINQLMVETVIDLDPIQEPATLDDGEGTTVRCTYHAVAFNENFRMQYAPEMLPVLSLRLLVAADYPNSSPKILDVLNVGLSDNKEAAAEIMAKTRLRFDKSLRQLSEPMSLAEMVKCWDVSASEVYREFAEQVGGECFSSKYGTWENCVTA